MFTLIVLYLNEVLPKVRQVCKHRRQSFSREGKAGIPRELGKIFALFKIQRESTAGAPGEMRSKEGPGQRGSVKPQRGV